MKRLFVALCLILILPLVLAQYTVYDYPDIDRLRQPRLKPKEVMPPFVSRVDYRTLESLRGLG